MSTRIGFISNFKRATFSFILLAVHTFALDKTKADSDRIDVAVLMFDKVQIIDFAAPYEVFGQAGFNVFTVSKDGEEVTTVMNLKVNPEYSFSNAPKADIILVPGGDVRQIELDQETLDWVRQNNEDASYTLSVCTGSRILAATGLLDGKEATTFHGDFNDLARKYPEIKVRRDERFVDSDGVVTSAGLVSGMDSALYLVSEILGEKRALTVASNLEYDWNPDNGYIRGLLADRHIPRLPGGFPKSWKVRRQFSYGDEQSWRYEFKIAEDASHNAIDYIRSKMDAVDAWTYVASSNKPKSSWSSVIDGESWELAIKVDTDKSMMLIEIDKVDTND